MRVAAETGERGVGALDVAVRAADYGVEVSAPLAVVEGGVGADYRRPEGASGRKSVELVKGTLLESYLIEVVLEGFVQPDPELGSTVGSRSKSSFVSGVTSAPLESTYRC